MNITATNQTKEPNTRRQETNSLKKDISQFAIFGGNPTFTDTLHVGRPNLGKRKDFLSKVSDILDRNWLTNNGPYVQEFERRIAEFLDVKHCISMCNGTIALEIAIRALGLKGEVIVPSFTFVATAHSLQWQEITPVFCDIDPVTLTIDPAKIERLITPRTSGIIGVHLWGRPCDITELNAIAQRNNLKLLFDASHAFGCTFGGKMIGGFGDAETFSFHATKIINTLEGGAVLTNSDELSDKMRLMKNFGFSGMDQVIYLGINGKMNEISAATGITSLDSFEEFISINQKNYLSYREYLSEIPGIKLLGYDESQKNNYQYVVIDIKENLAGISRDQLLKILHAENIRVRRYFYPGCHRMEPYISYYPNSSLLLPVTERLSKRILCLPTGPSINSEIIRKISMIIRLVVENAAEINQMLFDVEIHDKQRAISS